MKRLLFSQTFRRYSNWNWFTVASKINQTKEGITNCLSELKTQIEKQNLSPEDKKNAIVIARMNNFRHDILETVKSLLAESKICEEHQLFGSSTSTSFAPDNCVTFSYISIPSVTFKTFHLQAPHVPAITVDQDESKNRVLFLHTQQSKDMNTDILLSRLELAFPNTKIFGNCWNENRSCYFYENGKIHQSGSAGLLIEGDFNVDFVDTQGIRAIGAPFKIYSIDNNLLPGVPASVPASIATVVQQRLSCFGGDGKWLLVKITSQDYARHPKFQFVYWKDGGQLAFLSENASLNIGDSLEFYSFDNRESLFDIAKKLGKLEYIHSGGPMGVVTCSSMFLDIPDPESTESVKRGGREVDLDKYNFAREDGDYTPVDYHKEFNRIMTKHYNLPNFNSYSPFILYPTENGTTTTPTALATAIFTPRNKN